MLRRAEERGVEYFAVNPPVAAVQRAKIRKAVETTVETAPKSKGTKVKEAAKVLAKRGNKSASRKARVKGAKAKEVETATAKEEEKQEATQQQQKAVKGSKKKHTHTS